MTAKDMSGRVVMALNKSEPISCCRCFSMAISVSPSICILVVLGVVAVLRFPPSPLFSIALVISFSSDMDTPFEVCLIAIEQKSSTSHRIIHLTAEIRFSRESVNHPGLLEWVGGDTWSSQY